MISIFLFLLKWLFIICIVISILYFFIKLFKIDNTYAKKIENMFNQIKKFYEYIRQYFCKKSNEVNDDSGAVRDNNEIYDSSSEWQD
jgi:hypothetical protein